MHQVGLDPSAANTFALAQRVEAGPFSSYEGVYVHYANSYNARDV